jgi:hypothetical protein
LDSHVQNIQKETVDLLVLSSPPPLLPADADKRPVAGVQGIGVLVCCVEEMGGWDEVVSGGRALRMRMRRSERVERGRGGLWSAALIEEASRLGTRPDQDGPKRRRTTESTRADPTAKHGPECVNRQLPPPLRLACPNREPLTLLIKGRWEKQQGNFFLFKCCQHNCKLHAGH